MISTGELKKGVAIELDGELWQILDYHHIKMGRGSAQVRIKLRNIKRGQTVERTFQAGEKWPRAFLDRRPVQYLYSDGSDYHFMDTDSYEQITLSAEMLGDTTSYLTDGMPAGTYNTCYHSGGAVDQRVLTAFHTAFNATFKNADSTPLLLHVADGANSLEATLHARLDAYLP